MVSSFYVYILECNDGTLYTRVRLPCKLVYSEVYTSKQEAMSREWYIKNKLSRKDKLQLIQSYLCGIHG